MRLVPVTVQFETTTSNSLRSKRARLQIRRISPSHLANLIRRNGRGGTGRTSDLKSIVTLHCVGDVPLANVFAGASHVADPVVYEYTPNRFPFAPACCRVAAV